MPLDTDGSGTLYATRVDKGARDEDSFPRVVEHREKLVSLTPVCHSLSLSPGTETGALELAHRAVAPVVLRGLPAARATPAFAALPAWRHLPKYFPLKSPILTVRAAPFSPVRVTCHRSR